MNILGVVPARGGSKRLPQKNIKSLCGQPLIAYSIAAGLKTKSLTRLMCSTDDQAIAEIAKQFGAEVPFLRDASLSNDQAQTMPVIMDVLNYYQSKENYEPDLIVLLQPTSPLRLSWHIDEAVDLFMANPSAKAMVSVQAPIKYAATMKDSFLILPDSLASTKESFCQVNGAIYIAKPEVLQAEGSFFTDQTLAYPMDKQSSMDIDTALDFKIASTILRHLMPTAKDA